MSSEITYGITKQPLPTCPMIDSLLTKLKDCNSEFRGWEKSRDDAEYLANIVSNLEFIIYDLDSDLEKIRDNVTKIREWGQGWKDLAIDEMSEKEEEQ